MESAKNAISGFLGGSGQHKTDVDEQVAPAVTNETIQPHLHEETTQAVDREVHQDHYHTTVQPIAHKEVLPEQHTHQVAPTQEREFHHDDKAATEQKLAAEASQFRDTSVTEATTSSTAQAPAVAGEHTHHHVHETVQPVIHKETIQPEVVHTTVPIHEKHLAPSEHHGMSVLPTRTLGEFKEVGGNLTGGDRYHEEYQGDPRPYNSQMQPVRNDVDKNFAAHDGYHDHDHGRTTEGQATHGGSTSTGVGSTGAAMAGAGAGAAVVESAEHSHHGHGHHGHSTTSTSQTSANPAAMGTGVAGVGAGSAAADLGRDHVRAGENTDMTSRDLSSGQGTTEGSTVGTSLGGRAEGNTTTGAMDQAHGSTTGASLGTSDATVDRSSTSRRLEPSDREIERESSNTTGATGTTETRGTSDTTGGQHLGDDVQHASKSGRDPAMVGGEVKKLTGEGVDGSHSAVFGLTPDGHKHDETSHATTAPKPAFSKDRNTSTADDTGSRADAGAGVAGQMDDPKVAEKGHSGSAVYSEGAEKPGAGSMVPNQGTGDVKPGEDTTSTATEGKVNPFSG